jgi:DNA-binding NarL/FixJ family response regulator
MKIRVLISDGHALCRHAWRSFLAMDSGIKVIGAATINQHGLQHGSGALGLRGVRGLAYARDRGY